MREIIIAGEETLGPNIEVGREPKMTEEIKLYLMTEKNINSKNKMGQ